MDRTVVDWERRRDRARGPRSRELLLLSLATIAAVVLSGVRPHDRMTWWLEVAPVLIGWPALYLSRRSFPLTSLLYRLLFLHAVVLVVGAHYTYARVPLGNWAQDLLSLSRNHYDRLGHFAQGFVPAILARELLLRTSALERGTWLFVLVLCACLAFSAFYEMIEWWTAVLGGAASEAFLGTQGDVWDTQWDMFLAMLGAIAAQVCLAKVHDRELVQLDADLPLLPTNQ